MPEFIFPVFISTYYFYSFKPVSIPNASGGLPDFQNGALIQQGAHHMNKSYLFRLHLIS